MRLKSQKQLYFKIQSEYSSQEEGLVLMSLRLESLPGYEGILTKVLEDLNPSECGAGGRDGMTAEQVLRALVVKMRKGYSYRELAHATQDSLSVKDFQALSIFKRVSLQNVTGEHKIVERRNSRLAQL
jgi:hypothetical protein